jgi:hypothetical protein
MPVRIRRFIIMTHAKLGEYCDAAGDFFRLRPSLRCFAFTALGILKGKDYIQGRAGSDERPLNAVNILRGSNVGR